MTGFFNLELIAATIRMATPLLFAALGVIFISSSGVINISIEGSMLIGTFAAVVIGYLSQSLFIGVLAAGIGGMLLALILSYLIIYLKGDSIVVGIGGNLFAWGITVFILEELLHMRGAFTGDPVPFFNKIKIPGISSIPVLNVIASNHTLMVYIVVISVIVTWLIMYKTPIGLIIRSTGENAEAVQSIGVDTNKVKLLCFLGSGFLAGLGGACLSVSNLQGFWSENMTNGRGYIALCAAAFGKNNPKFVVLACILFGFADAIGFRFQVFQWEPSFVLMIPYIVTILMLWASSKRQIL